MERYQEKLNINPQVPPQLQKILSPFRQPNGSINVGNILRKADTSFHKVSRMVPGPNGEAVCPAYACGCCAFNSCYFAHMMDKELPKGFANELYKLMKPAIETILKEDNDPRKKPRLEDAGGGQATP